jgi:hypothetical protein
MKRNKIKKRENKKRGKRKRKKRKGEVLCTKIRMLQSYHHQN